MPEMLFRNAIAAISQIARTQEGTWWPRTQAERTVLAQAIALEWAERDNIGTRGREAWVSTCWGRDANLQRAVMDRYGVILPDAGQESATNGNRRFSARQMLLDFSIWPTDNANVRSLIHLTMESEMYPQHEVGSTVYAGNGYAYDFFKLLWCPSPRRVFAACTYNAHRRNTLTNSLDTVASSNAAFLGDDSLYVFILPPAQRHREDLRIGVWNARKRRFDWSTPALQV